MEAEVTPTWIIFASGHSVRIEISLYDPAAENNRPITAYIVSDAGSDIARSASRAAETVFAIAHEFKLAPPPTVAGFDLPGLKNGSQITGLSSGLALALALARKLWPEDNPGPIAATGEIVSSSNGGRLQKIVQIEAKARALIPLLTHGGSFFYPAANDQDISPELKNRLQEAGIKSYPVTSVSEALAIAFPEKFTPNEPDKLNQAKTAPTAAVAQTPKKSFPTCFLLVAILLAAALLSGSWFLKNYKTVTTASPQSLETPVAAAGVNHKPAKPTAAEPLPLKIKISGKSELEKILGRLTEPRLKALADSDREHFADLKSLSGRIKIIAIKEYWDDKTDSLNSTLTVTFQGKASKSDAAPQPILLKPVSVDGQGPMRKQLKRSATMIAEEISRALLNPDYSKPDDGKFSGRKNRDSTPDTVKNGPETGKNQHNQGFE